MITLLTFPAAFGQFSSSPFCVKAAYLLNMSGQMWQREDTLDPRKMPFSKLPVIRTDNRLIADSDGIRCHLEGLGVDFDQGLSPLDRANARAFTRMAEEHMYFHLVLDRWGNDDVWPIVRDTYFSSIPAFLRRVVTSKMRKTVIRGLHFQGLGRLSETERLRRLEPDIKAISARLGETDFLFGPKATGVDATVSAMLGAMAATPGDTMLKRKVANNAMLMGYVDQMETLLN